MQMKASGDESFSVFKPSVLLLLSQNVIPITRAQLLEVVMVSGLGLLSPSY